MNILGLDFGLKRIGTAVGSTESGIAFEREVLENDKNIWKNIENIIETDRIEKIIVGMPIKRDASEGKIALKVQEFIEEIVALYDLPIELIDERYTSKIARKKLHELDLDKSKRQKPIDALAAQVILQDYLDK